MLSHLRILDLTDGGASIAGRILSDLGTRLRDDHGVWRDGTEGRLGRHGPERDRRVQCALDDWRRGPSPPFVQHPPGIPARRVGSALLDYTVNRRITRARANALLHYAPSGVYRARGEERWIALAAPDEKGWRALDVLAGRGWSQDPRFATPEARLENCAELDAAIESWTRDQSVDDLEAHLQAAGIPAHRVQDTHDAFADPQLRAREHFIPIEYAALGPVPYKESCANLSATPAMLRPCPTLGQHNQEILSEILGLSDDQITDLVIAGAVE